jgi:hypothetical protein
LERRYRKPKIVLDLNCEYGKVRITNEGEDMDYCMFCENEAEYVIKGSNAPICRECKEIYEAGQQSPNDIIEEVEV